MSTRSELRCSVCSEFLCLTGDADGSETYTCPACGKEEMCYECSQAHEDEERDDAMRLARAEYDRLPKAESGCCNGSGRHPQLDDEYGTGLCECECPRCSDRAAELGDRIDAAMLRRES